MGDAEMRLKSQPSSGWLAESSLKRNLKTSFRKTLLHYNQKARNQAGLFVDSMEQISNLGFCTNQLKEVIQNLSHNRLLLQRWGEEIFLSPFAQISQ